MANKNYSDMRPDELMHYGRKGMKWGQNIFGKKEKSSGSKKRGDSDDDAGTPTKAKSKSSGTTKKKSVKEMSNAELNDAIRRLESEKRYHDLSNSKKSKAIKFVSKVGNDVLKPALINAGRNAAQAYVEKQLREAMGLNKKTDFDKLRDEKDRLKVQREYYETKEWLENYKKQQKKK